MVALPEKLPEKVLRKLERYFMRGLISQYEFDISAGKPEAWEKFFAASSTKRVTVKEFETLYPSIFLNQNQEWWEGFKKDVIQEGDELWCWDTIEFLTGSMGIVLVRGDKVLHKILLSQS